MKDKVVEDDAGLFLGEGGLLDASNMELLRKILAIFDVEMELKDDGSVLISHDDPSIVERIGDLIYRLSKGRYTPTRIKRDSSRQHPDPIHLEGKAMRFKQVRKMARLIRETTGDMSGLLICIPQSIGALSLSSDQAIAFCEAIPNGKELWLMYTARRDSSDTPEDYNFKSFVVEVLAKTKHPVLQ